MKKFRAPDNRQLLADLLAGNTLAKRQLSELRKPIKWLGGQCLSSGDSDLLPNDEVMDSITYRDGAVTPIQPIPYIEFVKLGEKAENAVLYVITNSSKENE